MFDETTADAFLRSAASAWQPVVRELPADLITPVGAAMRLLTPGEPSFLLESVEGGEQLGRWTLLGWNPTASLGAPGTGLDELRAFLARHRVNAIVAPAALAAGAVGYFTWDAVRLRESIPDRHGRRALPCFRFHHFRDHVVFDHVMQRMFLVTLSPPGRHRGPDEYAAARAVLDSIQARLAQPLDAVDVRPLAGVPSDGSLRVAPDAATFERMVRAAQELILAGDIFQVVLSRSFDRAFSGRPIDLYRALRMINPSPFLFFLDMGDHQVIGASPEDLVRVRGERVETLPIAGTRRRGRSPEEDASLAAELLGDPKERAEHVMLVDLARNDIGRVAVPGTVEVDRLMHVERYSHVMHLVSHVQARLRPELDALDAFFACFPAGTVSGAPKIRAMEIIDRFEEEPRGIYAGAVAYMDGRGNLDSCIALRTVVLEGGRARVRAGAGIVADSDPAAEEEETRNKAQAVLSALDHAGRLP